MFPTLEESLLTAQLNLKKTISPHPLLPHHHRWKTSVYMKVSIWYQAQLFSPFPLKTLMYIYLLL